MRSNPNREKDKIWFREGLLSDVPNKFGDTRFANGNEEIARQEVKHFESVGFKRIT